MKAINYKASSTGAKLHASDRVVRGFKGPVGNGKTVCCINELHRLAVDQWPNNEGVRKTRWVLVRNTYKELVTTTLNTFKQWVPDVVCPLVMSPIMIGRMKYALPDDTKVDAEFIFLALDRPDDIKKLLSLEVTGGFANEARELPYAVIKGLRERIGRYPARIDGYEDVYEDGDLVFDAPKKRNPDGTPELDADGEIQYLACKRKALLMDTNPPDDDHWWYQLAEEGALRGGQTPEAKRAVNEIFAFFNGPAPLIKTESGYIESSEAENIKFLPGGYKYYTDMIAGNTEDHINVMVLGNYGSIQDGRPVYPEYKDTTHCPAEPLKIIKDLPIGIGWDFGLTPAVVFGQMTQNGQLRVIAELFSEDMAARQFARDRVKPFIERNFHGMEIAFSFADPSGNARGEGEGKSAVGILNDDYVDNDDGDIIQPLNMGFTTEGAPTNDPTKRQDAVKSFLIKMVDGEPGYLLSKNCRMLRKGKNGQYQYRKMQVPGAEIKYTEKPDKNRYSHSADAEQYMALGFVGGYVMDRQEDDDYHEEHHETGVMGY